MADRKVKKKEDVTVYGTGTSKFFPAGQERTMHAVAAEKLIADGKATKEKPAESKQKNAQK